jgi:hypothetical protein
VSGPHEPGYRGAGSAFALGGSLFFLIDIWPILRRPRAEAEREYHESFPGLPQMGHDHYLAAVAAIETRLRRRRRYYAVGVVLIVVGFAVQTAGAFL